MTLASAPTADDLRAAFEGGAAVRFGLPVHAGHHILDLAAAHRGDPDPWWTHRERADGRVLDFSNSHDRSIYVEGRLAQGYDAMLVDKALDAQPSVDKRHSPEGEVAREEAGRHALQIRDSHLRAAMLTIVEGWNAVQTKLLDSSEDGELWEGTEDMRSKILKVTCPSTGRVYGHLVPGECTTARQGRRWMMGLEDHDDMPDVET